MIIVRSPLRITLGGGGTDLPSYYREHEGFLISAAIDKYVYVSVMRPFTQGIYLKYSQIEHVDEISAVKHPIIRAALSILNIQNPQIEITTLADIPAGTGLGSSSSFTTALLKAIYMHERNHLNQRELAELACHLEIDHLKEPIGKQDQYIAAVGGITVFNFNKDDSVVYSPLKISNDTLYQLEDNLLLFFTGFSRSASNILQDQQTKSKQQDQTMLENLNYVKKLGLASLDALENNDINLFGEIMHEHWQHKKHRSQGMSNEKIDEWYECAMQNGAIGGKLVGAGGGGFLMFLAHNKNLLRSTMQRFGLEEVRFRFDYEGTKVLMSH